MKITDLTWPDTLGLDDDLLLDVGTCRITLLVRGRNAWHSTWVQHYFRNSTLYSDVASAKRAAESLRGQGSVFYVSETAALVLTSEYSRIVVCDPVPDNPFGSFTGTDYKFSEGDEGPVVRGLYPGAPVREAVAAFAHDSGFWSGPVRSRNSLRLGRVNDGTLLPDLDESQPMISLTSRAVGANYPLSWVPKERAGVAPSFDGTRAVAQAWAGMLEELLEELPDADPEDPAALRRYRDVELGAEPWSVWQHRTTTQAAEDRARSIAEVGEWIAARDNAAKLRERLTKATAAREAAQEARMKPAGTSAGVRKQRERFEKALVLEERARGEYEEADALRARLWATIVPDG